MSGMGEDRVRPVRGRNLGTTRIKGNGPYEGDLQTSRVRTKEGQKRVFNGIIAPEDTDDIGIKTVTGEGNYRVRERNYKEIS